MELVNTHSGVAINIDGRYIILSEISTLSPPQTLHTVSTFHIYGCKVFLKGNDTEFWLFQEKLSYSEYSDSVKEKDTLDRITIKYNEFLQCWRK